MSPRPIPIKMTRNTPPMFWMEIPSLSSSILGQFFLLNSHQRDFRSSRNRWFNSCRILKIEVVCGRVKRIKDIKKIRHLGGYLSRQVVFRYANIRCFHVDVWEVNTDFIEIHRFLWNPQISIETEMCPLVLLTLILQFLCVVQWIYAWTHRKSVNFPWNPQNLHTWGLSVSSSNVFHLTKDQIYLMVWCYQTL